MNVWRIWSGICFQIVYVITMGEMGHHGWEVVVAGILLAQGIIALGVLIEGKKS